MALSFAQRAAAEKARSKELLVILRRITVRHYRGHLLRVSLTVAGLAAAVALLVAIGVINATLIHSIQSETRGFAGTAQLQVIPAGATPLPEAEVTTAQRTPGVQVALPILRVVSRIHSAALSEPLLLFAIPTDIQRGFPGGLGEATAAINSPLFSREGGLLLTSQLAKSLGVKTGSEISVDTPNGPRDMRVGGILDHNPFASVNGGVFALMALHAGQEVFGRSGQVSSIYVTPRPGVSRAVVRRQLRHELGTGVSIGAPGVEGKAYEQTFRTLAGVTERARGIGLIVALFLVINTMSMATAERRTEIALLATLGAKRFQIFSAFLAEAGLMGLVGGAIGVLVGALLAHALVQSAATTYNVLPITVSGPLKIELNTVMAALAGGFYTSIIGAAIAARRILRVAPAQALRPDANYEWTGEESTRPAYRRAAAGAVAVVLSALVAWRLPIGSQAAWFAVAAALAFAGSLLLIPYVMPLVGQQVSRIMRPLLDPSSRTGLDALARSPRRIAMTAGGIAVAAGFVIAVGSAIGSFGAATNEAADEWYRAPLYINLEGATSYIVNQPLPASVAQRLAGVEGVQALYPMRYGLINAYGHQTLIEAMPIAQAAAQGHNIMGSLGISHAALVRILGRGEVVVSRLTARHYHLVPGDVLQMPTTRGLVTVRVGGLFNDLASFDSVLVEHSVYERLSGDRQADRFAVVTQPGANVTAVKRRLEHLLKQQGIAASVLTGHEMSEYLVESIAGLFSIARGIEFAALVVAALIVLSTMAAATFERRREFGIQRALGMTRRQLGRSVVVEGATITLIGAIAAILVGLGLGLLITLSLEDQLGWPVAFRPSVGLIAGVAAISVIIGAGAALYPARRVARRPIPALIQTG